MRTELDPIEIEIIYGFIEKASKMQGLMDEAEKIAKGSDEDVWTHFMYGFSVGLTSKITEEAEELKKNIFGEAKK